MLEGNIMNTHLELYKVFCEVVKYKNISKAAENMFISQSAVTQSIQKLETLLGGKLFYRNRMGVDLTDEGRNLYEYVKDSIETMSNAENIFSEYANLQKGKIRIGGGNTLVTALIIDPLVSFIKEYPDINITIHSGITDELMQELANGEIDMVVLNLPYKNKNYSNVVITSLRKSNYSFFASKQYLKENPVKDLADIVNHTLILPKDTSARKKILRTYCEENSLDLQPNYEVSSSEIMKILVLNNIGIGFTSTENLDDIKDDIMIIHTIEDQNTTEGIATLKKGMCNKATLELSKKLVSYYKNT